jgi:hypothetical protein
MISSANISASILLKKKPKAETVMRGDQADRSESDPKWLRERKKCSVVDKTSRISDRESRSMIAPDSNKKNSFLDALPGPQ